MKKYDIKEMPNYRQIKSCANCKYIENMGCDEEYIECHLYFWDKENPRYAGTEHDYICDLYEAE